MNYSLTWLPNVLKGAGLKVAVVPGWETRGRGEMGIVLGTLCHTTVGPRSGNMPSLNTLIDGRKDLPGPLAQLGLGRDGTYYVVAAGRCNHAGAGSWQGVATGNSSYIGIEGENTGRGDDIWPAVQMDAYRRGVAALLKHIRRGADSCAGHKEYALPKGRKSDPDFDMDVFRAAVADILNESVVAPLLIPASEPGLTAGRPTIRRGIAGDLVVQVQKKIGAFLDGKFGARTEAAVREFQRLHGLVPDGIVGPKTWGALDQV